MRTARHLNANQLLGLTSLQLVLRLAGGPPAYIIIHTAHEHLGLALCF